MADEWTLTYEGVELHFRRQDTGYCTVTYKWGKHGIPMTMSCCEWAAFTDNYEYCDKHRSPWPLDDELESLEFDHE